MEKSFELVERRHIINESKIEYVTHNMNFYKGCVHNCQYPCYARTLSREKQDKWINVRVVKEARYLIECDYKRIANWMKRHERDPEIMISTMCDPYPPIEKELKLTRNIVGMIGNQGWPMRILTKSALIERDLDYFNIFPKGLIKVGFTIAMLNEQAREKWEPGASPISERVRILKDAHEMGLYTWVSVEPIILKVSEPKEIIEAVGSHVDQMIFGRHNYSYNGLYYRPAYNKIIREITDACENAGINYLIKKELLQMRMPGQQTLG